MSTLIAFVDTTSTKKRNALAAGIDDDYEPERDFYRQIRAAIKSGRRMNKDHLAMDGVLASCPRNKKQNYQELADGWLRYVASCNADTIIDLPTGRWHVSDLTVRVTPDLAIRRENGTYDAVKLYLRLDPPTARATAATLHLLRRAMTQCLPGARPVLLDVRRNTEHTRQADCAAWLEAEVSDLADLRTRSTNTPRRAA
ncbi:hypothetical protein [Actinoplanes lobatus]|uniref:Putative membrane protein n=1 Tax=Actinoplanes lobatus TaxID=113568 RepID=A0A7W7HRL7_9ACTN|nr:hypothetical protein [Actinoplanes lobatus]MBB4755197.1 putative membrane protein [Actinoplanes lobatus]GIE43402.1 hypothetical protein Alo02nite_63000 [Actinoplanes lobatus]